MNLTLRYLMTITLVFFNFPLWAAGKLENVQRSEKNPFEVFRQKELRVAQTTTLKNLVQVIEERFQTPQQLSVKRFLNKENSMIPISYSVQNRKIYFEVGGRISEIALNSDNSLSLNGIKLSDSDFKNSESLMQKTKLALAKDSQLNHVSYLNLMMNIFIPKAKADIGWMGIGAVALGGALLVAAAWIFGKKLSSTKHEVTINTPTNFKLDVPTNYNVTGAVNPIEVKATATGNLNASGTLTTNHNLNVGGGVTGLPQQIDIPLNLNLGGRGAQ